MNIDHILKSNKEVIQTINRRADEKNMSSNAVLGCLEIIGSAIEEPVDEHEDTIKKVINGLQTSAIEGFKLGRSAALRDLTKPSFN